MNHSSCYNCLNRKVGCHKNCETYKKYKAYIENIKQKKENESKFCYKRQRRDFSWKKI